MIFMKNNLYGSPFRLIGDSFEVLEDHGSAIVVISDELTHVD